MTRPSGEKRTPAGPEKRAFSDPSRAILPCKKPAGVASPVTLTIQLGDVSVCVRPPAASVAVDGFVGAVASDVTRTISTWTLRCTASDCACRRPLAIDSANTLTCRFCIQSPIAGMPMPRKIARMAIEIISSSKVKPSCENFLPVKDIPAAQASVLQRTLPTLFHDPTTSDDRAAPRRPKRTAFGAELVDGVCEACD